PDGQNPNGRIDEADEANNLYASKIGPFVVNVATHGFGNNFFADFLDNWHLLGGVLDNLPAQGSLLNNSVSGDGEGNGALPNTRVVTLVPEWSSSDGWLEAIRDVVAAGSFTLTGDYTAAAAAAQRVPVEMARARR